MTSPDDDLPSLDTLFGRAAERAGEPKPKEQARPSRTETIQVALRQAIIEQRLGPGMKLAEDAIGDSFGVSRTIAREALGRLATEGLVELKPNRGAFVASPTLDDARDVFTVRCGLERLVAENLAGRLSREDIAALRAFVEREHQAAHAQESEVSIRLSGDFHLLLAEMTGNQVLVKFVTEVVLRFSLILAMYGRPHSADCAVEEHSAIIDALERGDVAGIGELMTNHLTAVASRALLSPPRQRDLRELLAPYAARVAGLTD